MDKYDLSESNETHIKRMQQYGKSIKNYDLLLKRLSKTRPTEVPVEFNSFIEKTKRDVDILPFHKKQMIQQFGIGYVKLTRINHSETKKFSVDELTNEQIVKMHLEDFLDLAKSRQKKIVDNVINPTEFEGIKEWFIEIKKLHSGDYFGELALINNAPRVATITTIEPSSFAVIDRETYKKVLMKIE